MKAGEIWQTTEGDLVLLLERGYGGWSVMACDAHAWAQSDADLCLRSEETGLPQTLRLRVDHSGALGAGELTCRVGSIPPDLLLQLHQGAVPQERWGEELSGPDDPRLQADPQAWRRWMRRHPTAG